MSRPPSLQAQYVMQSLDSRQRLPFLPLSPVWLVHHKSWSTTCTCTFSCAFSSALGLAASLRYLMYGYIVLPSRSSMKIPGLSWRSGGDGEKRVLKPHVFSTFQHVLQSNRIRTRDLRN